jgi:hypothetical protein
MSSRIVPSCVSRLSGRAFTPTALKRLSHSLYALLRRAGRLARFDIHRRPCHYNFSCHCFTLFLSGGFFPHLVRKRRCTVTIDYVGAYSSTQNAFSARVAIFTQPAPLVATDVTKRPRHVQTWRVSLSIGMSRVTMIGAIQVYRFFCSVSENYE